MAAKVSAFTLSAVYFGPSSTKPMLLGVPAAYSLARYRTLGDNYSFWVLSIRMLPPVIFLIPISILFAIYGLSDTRIGIIIAYWGVDFFVRNSQHIFGVRPSA